MTPARERLPLLAVVVSYESADVLAECLEALGRELPRKAVVVVDNASSDGSAELARAAGVGVVVHASNEGFACGVNAGVRSAAADAYLLLNPDVTLLPGALAALQRCLTETGAAAVGPNLLDGDGQQSNDGYYLRLPSLGQVLLFYTSLRKLTKYFPALRRRYQRHEGLRGTRAVDQVPGGCMLVTAEAFEQIGVFDEDYLIWYEDVDWCERARRQGRSLMFCGEAQVRHLGGASFTKVATVEKELLGTLSLMRFLRLHRPAVARTYAYALRLDRWLRYRLRGDELQGEFLRRWRTQDIRLPQAALPVVGDGRR